MQTDLFSPTVFRLNLTLAQLEILLKPGLEDHKGGFAAFLREMRGRCDIGHGTFDVTESELDDAYRYAYAYGSGGWQGQAKVLCIAGWAAGWKGPR